MTSLQTTFPAVEYLLEKIIFHNYLKAFFCFKNKKKISKRLVFCKLFLTKTIIFLSNFVIYERPLFKPGVRAKEIATYVKKQKKKKSAIQKLGPPAQTKPGALTQTREGKTSESWRKADLYILGRVCRRPRACLLWLSFESFCIDIKLKWSERNVVWVVRGGFLKFLVKINVDWKGVWNVFLMFSVAR